MTRRVPVLLGVLASALVFSPSAGSAGLPKAPVITSISPKKLNVGDTLTIRGRNFLPGNFRNTVAFQKPRAQAVFLKADKATKTTIKITLTSKLLPFLSQNGGKAQTTRFSIRVLARRFGKSFTAKFLSPVIGPSRGPVPSGTPGCNPSPNSMEIDSDSDLLPDKLEIKLKLDPCKPDTDSDGVDDGYEYYSALDLNSRALPYAGKRPYPNPLDPGDANVDHDSDGLNLFDEYSAWVRYGGHKLGSGNDLLYSDGTQNSDGGPKPVPADKPWLDLDSDGTLSDDERDVENDGLGNWVELGGPMSSQAWWKTIWKDEKPYSVEFQGVDWLDNDSDGDGIPDGQDDQDHDDV